MTALLPETAPAPTVRVSPSGQLAVVALSGELDASSARLLRSELARLTSPHVVVDLRECTFVDAGVLAVLAAEQGALRRAGGELVLAGATGRVRRILAMAGFDRVVRVLT